MLTITKDELEALHARFPQLCTHATKHHLYAELSTEAAEYLSELRHGKAKQKRRNADKGQKWYYAPWERGRRNA